jgi:hypothetical protein
MLEDDNEVTVGTAFTVMDWFAEAEQPFPSVPDTVYSVVVVGLAVTCAPVIASRELVPAVHIYPAAPDAVSTELPPLHIVAADGVMDTTGLAFTVSFTGSLVDEQPPELTVLLYQVDCVCEEVV